MSVKAPRHPAQIALFAGASAAWTALLSVTAADVACPLKHGQWEPFPALTDEFEGGRRDESKWFPNNPDWPGRQPGYFNPKNFCVAGGMLHLDAKKESLPSAPAGCHAVEVDLRPAASKPRGAGEAHEFRTEAGSPIQVTVQH